MGGEATEVTEKWDKDNERRRVERGMETIVRKGCGETQEEKEEEDEGEERWSKIVARD